MIQSAATADRHRLATMSSPTGIFLIDASGELSFANPRLLSMANVPERDLLGLGFLKFFHPEDRDLAVRRIAEHLVDGGRACDDYRLDCAGTQQVWVRVWTSDVRDEEGVVTGLAGVVEDVTAVRAEEERTRALEAKLQQTHKLESLGVLAGGIAHDFNNLLVGITGNASLAQLDLPPGSAAAEALADLQVAAERAADLTTQLLAYAGRGVVSAHPVDFTSVIHETYTLLRTTLSPRARVALDLDAMLPKVQGDPTRLRQVVMNLLTNASDALVRGEGEISVRTALTQLDEAQRAALTVDGGVKLGAHLTLEVTDTGCGMDAETLARIFDPFFTTKKSGRGLGLAALVGTLRSHAGGLHVRSAPGQGTTFRLHLPLDASAPSTAAGAACAAPATAPAAAPATAPGTAFGTILVVDDESSVRNVTRRVLARAGFEVLEAADGASAVRTYTEARARIRCVLLDLSMPGIDGAETFRRLRVVDPAARVVLTSGHSRSDISGLFPDDGLAGFLQKPYDLSALLRVTRSVVEA